MCDDGIPLEPFGMRRNLLATLAFRTNSLALFAVGGRGFLVGAIFGVHVPGGHCRYFGAWSQVAAGADKAASDA